MREVRTSDKKFDDIAGYEDEKKYLMEICDFIKKPKVYQEMGAKLPKGLLISGIPGVGKTLLVKALLTEVKIPMYELSKEDALSEAEVIKEIKEMFRVAKSNKPSIIFIDEIDRIAIDDAEAMNVSDSSRKVLNQLLIEMDGFDNSEGILVVATANNRRTLGRALLRSGRFDRQIELYPPNKEERIKILEYYAKNKKLDKNISIEEVAIRCDRFTGSALETMLNEAAIIATSNNKEFITMQEIEIARDRLVNKGVVKIQKVSEIEREYRAYHEAGHTIVASTIKGKKVYGVSIYNVGLSEGRTSISSDEFERITKNELEQDLMITLGGIAAEKVHFGEMSLGATSDLENGLFRLREVITQTGAYGLQLTKLDGRSEMISNEKIIEIEKKEKEVFNKCLKKAIRIVRANKKQLDIIANKLLEKNVLYSGEIEELLRV